MKKVLFLMLFLLILGAVNVNSQVRIGGNGVPNGAAVLDLNATDGINNGTKGLALPRVSLSSNTVELQARVPNLNGMLVYNTTADLGAGVYYWDGSRWQAIMNGALVEADGIVGNEISDTMAGGGLTRSGAGTAASPYKVGITTTGAAQNSVLKFIDGRWIPSTVNFGTYRYVSGFFCADKQVGELCKVGFSDISWGVCPQYAGITTLQTTDYDQVWTIGWHNEQDSIQAAMVTGAPGRGFAVIVSCMGPM